MIRFLLTLFFVAVLLVAMFLGFIHQHWIGGLPSYFFQTLIFLLFGTSLLYIYLYRFNKPGLFIQLYLLTVAIKIVAYGAYNFIMILADKNGAAQNVIWFLALYFIFTGLEIGFLHRKITKDEA